MISKSINNTLITSIIFICIVFTSCLYNTEYICPKNSYSIYTNLFSIKRKAFARSTNNELLDVFNALVGKRLVLKSALICASNHDTIDVMKDYYADDILKLNNDSTFTYTDGLKRHPLNDRLGSMIIPYSQIGTSGWWYLISRKDFTNEITNKTNASISDILKGYISDSNVKYLLVLVSNKGYNNCALVPLEYVNLSNSCLISKYSIYYPKLDTSSSFLKLDEIFDFMK